MSTLHQRLCRGKVADGTAGALSRTHKRRPELVHIRSTASLDRERLAHRESLILPAANGTADVRLCPPVADADDIIIAAFP